MARYEEQSINTVFSVVFLIVVFLLLFQPWQIGFKELYWQEGIYAAEAMELSTDSLPVAMAHGKLQGNGFPLYPILVRGIYECGVPMEYALRLLSLLPAFGVAVWVFLLGRGAAGTLGGSVAASVWLTSNIVMEKSLDGYPLNATVFFVMAGQFLWFTLGQRYNHWNLAWVSSGLMTALAFYTGGLPALLFSYFPFIFQRRPLSMSAKLKYPGAVVAGGLVLLVIFIWAIPFLNAPGSEKITFFNDNYLRGFSEHLWTFPFDVIWRFMPWSLIAWPVFCAAFRPLDPTPILSRYLRTLFIANFFLLWLSPFTEVRDMILLLPSLSILIGINYALLARRHGNFYRKILHFIPYLVILLGMFTAGFFLMDNAQLENINEYISLPAERLAFRLESLSRIVGIASGGVIFMVGLYLLLWRNRVPLWVAGVLVMTAFMVFYWSIARPYSIRKTPKQELALAVKSALTGQVPQRIYKLNIKGLYGELFYLNLPVTEISDLSELSESDAEVYLLCTGFPQLPERSWSKLMELKLFDASADEKALQLYVGKLVQPLAALPQNQSSTLE